MTQLEKLLILGTSNFPEEIADIAAAAGFEVTGFVDNMDPARKGTEKLGLPVYWIDDLAELKRDHLVVGGLGTTTRERIIQEATKLGAEFATVVHPAATLSPSCTVGRGCVVGPGVVVAAQTHVAEHVVLNRGCLIGHHSRIETFTSIGPGANVAGNCSIGVGVYVGIGASIINQVTVAEGAVVGAGAVVTKDVAAATLVLGVPARVVKTGIERM